LVTTAGPSVLIAMAAVWQNAFSSSSFLVFNNPSY
jgi:hypothetical protein